jgi:hypothetical protein
MNKEEVLKAFEGLSASDQRAVRTELAERGAAGCCGSDEMQQHMAAMMKMMQSSEKPTESCQQMMGMCEQMMRKEKATAGTAP